MLYSTSVVATLCDGMMATQRSDQPAAV